MYPRDDLRLCARHIAAQCREAVLASRFTELKSVREAATVDFVANIGLSTSLVNRENRLIPKHSARLRSRFRAKVRPIVPLLSQSAPASCAAAVVKSPR